MPDAHQTQVIPEGLGDVASAVIRQELSALLDRYIGHAGSVHRFLNHLNQGVSRHVFLQLPGQNETGIVVHHGHQVAPALTTRK
jgi:hypothetical protein